MSIQNFAYYVSEIMTMKPGTCRLPVSETQSVEIVIKGVGDVWDSVYIDRVWCGNRCGGREVFATLVWGQYGKIKNRPDLETRRTVEMILDHS
jgi:hypothetical protein